MSSTDPSKPDPERDEEADAPDGPDSETEYGAFILSLATAALLQMGEEEPPGDSVPVPIDFPLAKHTIDIIGMLHDKTRGNVTEAEAKLVETVLYDLRLRFLTAQRKHRCG